MATVATLRAAHTAWSYVRTPPLLPPATAATDDTHVTIVVPARDEEAVLDRCLEGIRGQTHRRFELVIVDDGSTDATPEIAARHAAADERVRVVQAGPLPEGWSGKVHAMHRGIEAARDGGLGDWLLFLDADTQARPDLVARMLRTAREMELDIASTAGGPPEERSLTWWLLMPAGAQLIAENAAPGGRVPRRKALAVGHCLLMRKSSYEKVGGWSELYGARPEDIAMATRIRDLGGTTGFLSGTDELRTSGVDPFPAGWASFRKSMVTGTRANVRLCGWGGVAHLIFGLTPPIALAAGMAKKDRALAAAGAVGWAAQATGHLLGSRRMRAPAAAALLAPASWSLVGGVLLDAARKARTRSVAWKGRTISR